METSSGRNDLVHAGLQLKGWLIAFRRDLHSYPEVSLKESATAAKVAQELRSLGLDAKSDVGGHGIIADLTGSRPGRTIALRADMDALPIQEEADLPFASKNPGVMHACGHDAHTSILLGAARLLVERKEQLAGKIRFLFQPAEEVLAGAKAMVSEGALAGVDEIYGLHNLPSLSVGKVATCQGPMLASVDRIEITVEGKGGHGAIPDMAIDPIVASSAIVMGLQTAVSREISPFHPVVVTIGSIHGGDANNVIPQRVKLTGTVRTFSPEVRKALPSRLQRIIEHIALAYRCNAMIEYEQQVPPLASANACITHVEGIADDLIGRHNRVAAAPIMGGEDFAAYLEHVPGCFFWLGSGPAEGAEQAFGLHHPKYELNEECLPLGASLMAAIAIRRAEA